MKFGKLILFVSLIGMSVVRLPAQTNEVRALTLEDVIKLALEHNLDVQIERVNPEISYFNLNAAYAPYDPTFSFRAQQRYISNPGGFDANTGLPAPATDSYTESFEPGLSGTLPTGLAYNFSADLADRTSGTYYDTNGVSQNRGNEYHPTASVDLSQPILRNFWIDATRQNIQVNKKTLKISELGVQGRIMDVINRVEQTYYDLIFAIENVKVQEKALELADRLLSENKRRVQVGALAPLDEKQAESQVAGSRADLLSAHRDLDLQENILKSLITDDYKLWYNINLRPEEKLIAVRENLNVLESWGHGMTQRPDLLQAQIDLERRDIVLRYQHNQLFPQLDLIGSYGRNGLEKHFDSALENISDDKYPTYSYGVLFSIPLSNRGPRNQYRTAKSDKEQALLQFKKLEQSIMVQIDDSVKSAQTSFQRVDATKQARLYAEAALEAEQKKLENGKSTSFVVLQLQRDLTTARSQEIRALADYNKSLAQLSFNEGTVLERNHLTVDVK